MTSPKADMGAKVLVSASIAIATTVFDAVNLNGYCLEDTLVCETV
ncbi:hypothetical protein [Oculatella sp. LEGE 06141]|nr:hypothetical protein [Oculatella sp. LEGE 06141]